MIDNPAATPNPTGALASLAARLRRLHDRIADPAAGPALWIDDPAVRPIVLADLAAAAGASESLAFVERRLAVGESRLRLEPARADERIHDRAETLLALLFERANAREEALLVVDGALRDVGRFAWEGETAPGYRALAERVRALVRLGHAAGEALRRLGVDDATAAALAPVAEALADVRRHGGPIFPVDDELAATILAVLEDGEPSEARVRALRSDLRREALEDAQRGLEVLAAAVRPIIDNVGALVSGLLHTDEGRAALIRAAGLGDVVDLEVERRLRLLAEESERVPERPRVAATKTAIVADRRGSCERCNADVPVRAAGDGYECADCGAMLLGDFPAELSAPAEGARRPWPKVETKNVGGRGPRVVVSWPDGDGWDLTIPAARELAEGIRDALGLEVPAVATLRRIARAVSAPECEDLAENLGPEDYEDLVGTVEAMLGDRATGYAARATRELVVDVARRWLRAGASVVVAEAGPVDLGVPSWTVELADEEVDRRARPGRTEHLTIALAADLGRW